MIPARGMAKVVELRPIPGSIFPAGGVPLAKWFGA
jgi:hypothetical protein